jgi:hypothetical protein
VLLDVRTSLVFLIAGTLAVASSLQQIYEKALGQDHRRVRDLYRLLTWVVVLGLTVVLESLAERSASNTAAGGWLAMLVTAAIIAPVFWWTMHFLLAGRCFGADCCRQRSLPGVFFGGVEVFSVAGAVREYRKN